MPDGEPELPKEMGMNLIPNDQIDELEPQISKGFFTELTPLPRLLLGVISEWRNKDVAGSLQKLADQVALDTTFSKAIWDVWCRF